MTIELVFGESCPHVRNKVNFHLQIGYLSLQIQLHLRTHGLHGLNPPDTHDNNISILHRDRDRDREVTIVNQSTDTDL